jgi:hypothetical protein
MTDPMIKAAPEGWKLVPLEPTPATLRALFNWLADNDLPGVEYEDAENCYRVFVQADNPNFADISHAKDGMGE